MADKNYTYAVARIRAMETALFSSSVIEQLMAVKTWSGCLDFLREKGWGSGNLNEGAEEMLEGAEDSQGSPGRRRQDSVSVQLSEAVP